MAKQTVEKGIVNAMAGVYTRMGVEWYDKNLNRPGVAGVQERRFSLKLKAQGLQQQNPPRQGVHK